MNRPKSGGQDAGFTLIELLTVLAIALVVLALGSVPLMKMYIRFQLEGMAQGASVAMQQARLQAIRRSQQAQVCAQVDAVTGLGRIVATRGGGVQFARIELSKTVRFGAPGSQPAITVPGDCFTFLPDGSVTATGAFRLADVRGNFLEIRVEPQATARVQLRKWDETDSQWYTRDQGGKAWEWSVVKGAV
jgi:prepilin-type N-terminal cleavage/methylation domain-containing protein